MIDMDIKVEGISEIGAMYARRPAVVKNYINKAIQASIFEIEKQAVDQNFQFKTPRAFRTGYLQRSFKFGIVMRDFFGAIGPTARYAFKVHRTNPFMHRIANMAQPKVEKHFETALKFIVEDLAKGKA